MTSPAFRLIMRSGPTPGQVYDLIQAEVWIGRNLTNDITINDGEVSRRHALLHFEAGTYVIEDQNSTNGSYVNGIRLMGPHSLLAGESIRLGENVELVFEALRPDLAATVVRPIEDLKIPVPVAFPPTPAPAAPPQPVQVSPPPPAAPDWVEQINTMQEDVEEVEFGRSSRELWMMAGCGCLVLVAVACAAAVLAIEYYNLWCTLFGSFIPGC